MQMENNNDFYIQLLNNNSNLQIIVAIEELGELQKELCKHLRNKGNKNNLVEEFTDVIIVMEQIKLHFNIKDDDIEKIKKQKIERTKKILAKEIEKMF